VNPKESTDDQTLDLLAHTPFPKLAQALRVRIPSVILKWEAAVVVILPKADTLTLKELRNSLPQILVKIADALETDEAGPTQDLIEGSKIHGIARIHDEYNVCELLVEYRLLRRILFEQVAEQLDEPVSKNQMIALNMAVDTTIQSGIVAFTDFQRGQIKAGSEVQAKYLSFLSHDLRNHLNHATLTLELLGRRLERNPGFTESVKDVVSIQRSIFQTIAGMDRLLRAEQLRNQSIKLNLGPVDLQRMFAEVVSIAFSEAQAKGLSIDAITPSGAQIVSDRDLLMLVLHNLVGNAVKYSSRGKIQISADEAPDPARGWILSVSDQGPGIAPEHLQHLFEAFRRGDTHGQSGLGLGLSIASHAAKLLDGRMEIDSTVGKGSTFSLHLPAAKST